MRRLRVPPALLVMGGSLSAGVSRCLVAVLLPPRLGVFSGSDAAAALTLLALGDSKDGSSACSSSASPPRGFFWPAFFLAALRARGEKRRVRCATTLTHRLVASCTAGGASSSKVSDVRTPRFFFCFLFSVSPPVLGLEEAALGVEDERCT